MENLYVDESGSMTCKYTDDFPCFVVCTVRAKDIEKLKRAYKRFISKNITALSAIGQQKMFRNGKFKELKGSCLPFELKQQFAEHFMRPELLELFYIKIDNTLISSVKPRLYDNTGRAFNYLYKLMLEDLLCEGLLPKDKYNLQLDNRNIKFESINSLEDYLNTELFYDNELTEEISVSYFDSRNNAIIQIADVFSNIYYSAYFQPQKYQPILEIMQNSGCLKKIFTFPEQSS